MAGKGKIVALIVAAGSGSRAGSALPKQYARLAGKAVLAHAVDHLRHAGIEQIRAVIAAGQEQLYLDAIGTRTLPSPIVGGPTRQQSVRNGLEALAREGGVAAVLIHDAARPFLPARVLAAQLEALDRHEATVPVLAVADSLARADNALGEPVDRANTVRVQTPQAFPFEPILAAHRAWTGAAEASDDAQVARSAGLTVGTVPGSPLLDKITYEEDLLRAEQRLAASLSTRSGLGFDVHAFGAGDALWLGGIRIPHSRGLAGHSDADVLLHAITDAILGAIAEGDIGDHFPPSDPQWKGAASSRFVEYARDLVERRDGRIEHVDATIICEAPKIGPHRLAMRQAVAGLLRLPLARVSIKATTTERLGFTGRGEGIAAQAIVTVRVSEDI
jgi:2-C-methyl-D-erythritol 4-phosphate cytidylyltransferase / 2-C-methyl-D-erythritol 2,4-cyclodiphosphate synthase